MTPQQIAGEVQAALRSLPPDDPARRRLQEGLDAVADGMPLDYVARILYAALRDLERP